MDWHLVITLIGYAATVGVFLWKMGSFTSRLETVVYALKEDVTSMKAYAEKLARHDERIAALEKKKR